MVDLFDGYRSLYSVGSNPIYGSLPLNWPYLIKAEDRTLVDQQPAFLLILQQQNILRLKNYKVVFFLPVLGYTNS